MRNASELARAALEDIASRRTTDKERLETITAAIGCAQDEMAEVAFACIAELMERGGRFSETLDRYLPDVTGETRQTLSTRYREWLEDRLDLDREPEDA